MCEPGHTVSYIEPHRTSPWSGRFFHGIRGEIWRDPTAGYRGILRDTGRYWEIPRERRDTSGQTIWGGGEMRGDTGSKKDKEQHNTTTEGR